MSNTTANLCVCLPYSYAPARPVNHLDEVEVIDPTCKWHGDKP